MSTTIDSRVVEMKFDNKHFEKNVSTTMSTLDKLKQKLNLTGASKGLEDVNTAARKVDLSGISTAVDKVGIKFNGLYTIADQALRNITNKAMYYGEKMASALTTDPIKTGFSEYETQINAIQTILANTSSKGTTLDDVNNALETLNKYADKTIYNFTEMTRNIGTFTAAGIDLDTSVNAIQGIANLAAVSGSTSQQASTAMYQLSQALASGTVKLMDWNSVVNAGMGGQVFQDALKETARAHGIAIDSIIEKNGSFRDSLHEEWLTADILTETLQKFTLTTEGLTEAQIEQNRVMLRGRGYTEEQIDEIFKLGETATNAATKVKTFTQLWDTLKESAQSGWTNTWELLIGDFETAKNLLTKISESIGGIIGRASTRRNNILEGALYGSESKWDVLNERLKEAGISTDEFKENLIETAKAHGVAIDDMIKEEGSFEDTIKKGWLTKEMLFETLDKYTGRLDETAKSTGSAADKLKEFQKIVDDVWLGIYGNGEVRSSKLEKAGYNYELIQSLVNLTEHVEGHKLKLEDLSEAQLKSMGLTEDQAKAIHDLGEEAKATGVPIEDLIKDLTRPSGRELLLQSFANIVEAIKVPLNSFREAWKNVFGEITEEQRSEQLYKLLEWLRGFTEALIMDESTAANFQKICEGLMTLWEISWDMVSASMSTTIKLVKAVLGLFGLDLMGAMAKVAEYLTKFGEWLRENTMYYDTLEKIANIIYKIIDGIIKCVKAFLELTPVKKLIEDIKDAVIKFFEAFDNVTSLGAISVAGALIDKIFTRIKTWIESLEGSENLGADIINGIVNGIKWASSKAVSGIIEFATQLVEAFCNFLGIESPSKVFYALGVFLILGLINGIKDSTSGIFATIKSVGSSLFDGLLETLQNGVPYIFSLVGALFTKLLGFFKDQNIDFSEIFVMGSIVTLFVFLKKIIDVIEAFSKPFSGLGGMLDSIKDGVKNVSDAIVTNIKTSTWEKRSSIILNIAKSIGILAASMWLLSKVPGDDLVKAGFTIAFLAGTLAALMAVASIIPDGFTFVKLGIAMGGIATGLLLMSAAIKVLSTIDTDTAWTAVEQLGWIITYISAMLAVYGIFVKGKSADNINSAAKMIRKLAVTIAILAVVIKLVAGLSSAEIDKGLQVILGIEILFVAVLYASKLAGDNAKEAGQMLLRMSIAIGLMVIVIKLIAGIPDSDIKKGLLTIAAVTVLFGAIIAVSYLAGKHAKQAGQMLLRMSIAIGILALTIKFFGTISKSDIAKAADVMTGALFLFGFFMVVTNSYEGKYADKAGKLFLSLAAAVGVIAIAIKLIAGLSLGDILKGITVLAACGTLFWFMVAISKIAGEHADKAGVMLLKMSFAILVLSGAIAILSLLDPLEVWNGTLAISMLIGMFSLLVKASSMMTSSTKAIYAMAVTIGILAGAIALLSMIDTPDDPTKLLRVSGALSLLLGAFAILVKCTKYVQSYKLATNMIILTSVVAALAGILYVIQGLPVESTIANAIGLSTLLLAISAAIFILSTVGMVSKSATKALVPMMLIVGGLALIIGLLGALKLSISIETAMSLSTLLLAMTVVFAVLTALGTASPAAIAGALAFDIVIVLIAGLLMALGEIMDEIDGAEEFLDKGIVVLEKVGEAIGSLFGGFFKGVGSGLPKLGEDLSKFMENLSGFISGASSINVEDLQGIKELAETINTFSSANNGDKLEKFGEQLAPFAEKLMGFARSTERLDDDVIERIRDVALAAQELATMAQTLPDTSGFKDNEYIINFAEQLVPLGTSLVNYVRSVERLDETAIAKIQSSAKAIQAVADLAASIPNVGGAVALFTGDNSLSKFAEQLVPFAKGLVDYVGEVDSLDENAVTKITNSVKSTEALVKMAETIPNTGGLVSAFTGDNNLAMFAAQLVPFGTALINYVRSIDRLDENAVTKIQSSVESAKALVDMADAIPESGGLVSFFGGDNDLEAFAYKLIPFGNALSDYSTSIADVDVGAITTSKVAVGTLVDMFNNMKKLDTSGVRPFTKALKEMAEAAVTQFINAYNSSSTAFFDIGSKMIDNVVQGVQHKTSAVTTKITSVINTMIMTIDESKSNFESSGSQVIDKFISGVSVTGTNIASAIRTIVSNAVSTASLYYESFKSTGAYLVVGFAAGITANEWRSEAAARAMAGAALDAAKKRLDQHSPSKEFYKIGDFAGQGFVNALDDYVDISYKSGSRMADSARSGLSQAIDKVYDIINTDMDTQPTIRPVLDLSDVQSGVGTINGMFGLRPSVGAMANLNAISYSMRNQNGANDDVVYAIDKLRKDIGDIGGTSYSINGISYNDDVAVGEAIEALVRAIRIERRV